MRVAGAIQMASQAYHDLHIIVAAPEVFRSLASTRVVRRLVWHRASSAKYITELYSEAPQEVL